MSISKLLVEAQQAIHRQLEISAYEAKLEAQLLLERVFNVNRAWLITHETDKPSSEQHQAFATLVQRRITGEPIAYILGEREFYGLKLKVTPDTLIPRSDTETLVEAALVKIPKDSPYTILDLGTGSGAIALALAKHRPLAQVLAVDASEKSLTIAKENAHNLNISNVHFMVSDWFNTLQNQTFDMIVSNPPYIAQNDVHLKQGDLRFEPFTALTSGTDGLDDIRQIISDAPQYLKPNGCLLLEHGYDQAQMVTNLLAQNNFTQVAHIKDLANIDRVTLGYWQ